jgi:hypothetical protein
MLPLTTRLEIHRNKSLQDKISRLKAARKKLSELQQELGRNPFLSSNKEFRNRRYVVLKRILNDLPEDQAGKFSALNGEVCRNRYRATWKTENLDCYIQFLQEQL